MKEMEERKEPRKTRVELRERWSACEMGPRRASGMLGNEMSSRLGGGWDGERVGKWEKRDRGEEEGARRA